MSPRAVASRTFRSLKVRNYRLYFFGQIVSMSGTWMQSIAQMWLVYQLTGSGVALGLITALQFLPVLLIGAWCGVLADRFDKRKIILATQSSAALLALTLWALTATGSIELWMLYGLALAFGLVTAVEVPARQSFVIEMVGPEDLPNAIGLNSTVFTSARVIGPAIGGVLIATVGIAICFLVNALSFIAVIFVLLKMDPRDLHPVERVARGRGQLRAGLAYVWENQDLRLAMLLMTVVGTLAFNFRIVLPVMASRTFGGGAGTYGALSAVMGVGTVIGALLVASRAAPTRKMLVGSAFVYGVLICIGSLAPTLITEMIVLVPMGAAGIAFVATANSTLQLNSSDAMRGRVMALYSVVFLGSTPIGSPIVGWATEALGVRVGFALGGVASLLAAGAAGWVLLKRRRERLVYLQVPPSTPDDPATLTTEVA